MRSFSLQQIRFCTIIKLREEPVMALLDTELKEAIEASETALTKLEDAKSCLESASGWGIFDLLGGGLIASAVKHSRIAEARRKFEDAKESVLVFADELDDVDEFVDVTFDTGGTLQAFDIFFDNVIADAIMQSKIRDIIQQIDACIFQIRDVQSRLIDRYHSMY